MSFIDKIKKDKLVFAIIIIPIFLFLIETIYTIFCLGYISINLIGYIIDYIIINIPIIWLIKYSMSRCNEKFLMILSLCSLIREIILSIISLISYIGEDTSIYFLLMNCSNSIIFSLIIYTALKKIGIIDVIKITKIIKVLVLIYIVFTTFFIFEIKPGGTYTAILMISNYSSYVIFAALIFIIVPKSLITIQLNKLVTKSNSLADVLIHLTQSYENGELSQEIYTKLRTELINNI